MRWTSAGQNFSEALLVRAVADAGQVVVQGVEPDVDRVLRVVRDGDAPLDRRPGDAQVLEPPADEARDLVHPALGPDELRMRLVELEEPVLVGREPEEIDLLRDERAGLLAAVRAGLAPFGPEGDVVGEEVLVGDAVPALVRRPCRCRPCPGASGRAFWTPCSWTGVGRPDEAVVRDVEGLPEVLRTGRRSGRRSSLGVRPRSAAAFSIFWPCSSVPVRKKTSRPRSRLNRARASAMIVV